MTKNKRNIESLYSVIFLAFANLIFWFDPLHLVFNFVFSFQFVWDFLSHLGPFWISAINAVTMNATNFLFFLFVILSAYTGAKSLKKLSLTVEKKFLNFIPKNISGFLIFVVTFFALIEILVWLITTFYLAKV
jgi:hypothetical protein